MNQIQLQNIQESVERIGEVISKCRDYVQLLRGLHLGRLESSENSEEFVIALDVMYRSAWEALFAAFGTLVDRSKATYSLNALLSRVRKYAEQDHPIRQLVKRIEADLRDPGNKLFVRMEKWRMNFVAHHSEESRSDAFHADNKVHFDEAAAAIDQIEEMVNLIAIHLLEARYEFRLRDANELEKQVKRLFGVV